MVTPKIITCAGYYGTGSSAITDLLGEFSNIYFMGDYEFRFIQDPYGISDLEYNIVENYHRHNSGYALKRFKKNVDFLSGNRFLKRYEAFFQGQFKSITYDYINKLIAFQFKGYWHQDVIDRGLWFWWIERSLDKILNKIIVPIIRGRKNIEPISIHLLKNEITYVPYSDRDYFYRITKEYIDNLFLVANKDGKEFIMVDQLVPPSNTERYLKYFNDLKIFSVDRDPRDLYLLEKYIWKGGVVPVNNVRDYCKWYEITRNHREYEKDDSTKVMRLYFEDLIYHYDETVDTVCGFLGIDRACHIKPKTKLIPFESIKNTRIWKQYPNISDDIEYVKDQLDKYCYKNY